MTTKALAKVTRNLVLQLASKITSDKAHVASPTKSWAF